MERLRSSDAQALVLALRELEGAVVLSARRDKVGRVAWVRYADDLELPDELAVRRSWPKRDVVTVPLRCIAKVDAVRRVVELDEQAEGRLHGGRSGKRSWPLWFGRLQRRASR